jgi:hypothetical protein
MSVSSQQINTYLQDDNFIDGIPKSPAGLVRYAMALASSTLAKRFKKPSKETPIIIANKNIIPIDKIHYLWTALMVFGTRTPNLKFGNESITISGDNVLFDPAKELGFQTLFSENSLYETVFKHHITEDMLKISPFARAFDCIPLDKHLFFKEQNTYVKRLLDKNRVEASRQVATIGQEESRIEKKQKEVEKTDPKELISKILNTPLLFPTKPSERVKFAMAFANFLLVSATKPPSEASKLQIDANKMPRGFARYLWTALMVFGESLPKMSFNHKAIDIQGCSHLHAEFRFYEEKELGGLWTTFSSNSLYETVFKHHLTKGMLKLTLNPELFADISNKGYRTVAQQIEAKEKKIPEELKKAEAKKLHIEELFNPSLFPAEPTARVKFAMALANFILIDIEPPSEKSPIVLKGTHENPEFCKYFWTAMMVFGKTHPYYSFDHKSILILREFSEEKELGGFWSTFSKNSLHETLFKDNITKDMLILTDNPEFFVGISRLKYKTVGEQIKAKKQEDIKEKEAIRKSEEFDKETTAIFQEERRIREQEKARMLEVCRKNEELEVARKWEAIRKQEEARKQELAWQKELALRKEHAFRHEQTSRQEQILRQEQALRQEEIRKKEESNNLEETRRLQEAKRLEEIKVIEETFENFLNSTNTTENDLLGLGLSYYEGKQNLERDYTKARLCFAKASELGSHIALYNLGHMDQYVEKNCLKATRNYQLAAYSGYELAQSQLTNLFHSESLTAQELTALAQMYFQGDHEIIKDRPLAIKLYNKACERHDSSAALFLAQYHQINEENGKDINLAFSYYILAVKYGNPEVFAALERLADDLSPNHQLELSQLYGRFFHDNQRATYWRNKSMEITQPQFDIQFT